MPPVKITKKARVTCGKRGKTDLENISLVVSAGKYVTGACAKIVSCQPINN